MTQTDYAKRLTALSARQIEVLRSLGMGMSQKQAADSLGISVRTLQEHSKVMQAKLSCNTVQAIVIAAKAGLV